MSSTNDTRAEIRHYAEQIGTIIHTTIAVLVRAFDKGQLMTHDMVDDEVRSLTMSTNETGVSRDLVTYGPQHYFKFAKVLVRDERGYLRFSPEIEETVNACRWYVPAKRYPKVR